MGFDVLGAIIKLSMPQLRDSKLSRVYCSVNFDLSFSVTVHYDIRFHFSRTDADWVVSVTMTDKDGKTLFSVLDNVPNNTEKTFGDLVDLLITNWKESHLCYLISIGTIKKTDGELFDIESDPLFKEMTEIYVNKDNLSTEELIAKWNQLPLNFSYAELTECGFKKTV